ncbi:acidic terminal segment protein [Plasmodium falciparum NF135/5.C10]|uniref:Acidic terminal segment protein n=1 Tax=Plasmodium falciparum NF135/5.C10 TaxID=1036726 RepID=W4INK3_PLAFA|nr:acidic terminal segment protein [Plasmodium falciparum NF135/5.C10]
MLQNEPNTEPNILHDNLDNNTHPTPSHNKLDQKPFIMFIQDRNLLNGEEYNYDMFNSGKNGPYSDKNDLYSGNHDSLSGNRDPTSDNHVLYSGNHHPYSGIDLINDSLSGNKHIDIYDELLKRKENELFGTNHVKQTSIHSVAKLTNSDPLLNQLELFHKWLDRHRDMCEKWDTNNKKEELLDKLNEQWNKENNNNSGTPSDNTTPTTGITPPTSGNTPPTSDIPSDNNIHSDIPYVLNTDVSIQIHMDNPKPTNEFTYVDSNPNQVDDPYVDSNPDNSSMDTILDDLEKYNEPYYDVQDDIYYDVHDHDASTVDSNAMDVPSKVQIEMDVNTKLVKEKYPISDVWDI